MPTVSDWMRGYVLEYVPDDEVAEAVAAIVEDKMDDFADVPLTPPVRSALEERMAGRSGSLTDAAREACTAVAPDRSWAASPEQIARQVLQEGNHRMQEAGVTPATTLPPVLYEQMVEDITTALEQALGE